MCNKQGHDIICFCVTCRHQVKHPKGGLCWSICLGMDSKDHISDCQWESTDIVHNEQDDIDAQADADNQRQAEEEAGLAKEQARAENEANAPAEADAAAAEAEAQYYEC